ncbi:hypothetical protein CEP52_007591 [Fusarium oligoseptatum]|uniref:Uncharacterized protein n=1 Tax=Fusarium oligoseptatum TaxID=2604345 RepID=A0A428TM36_9HYPO|nr:hypothetical protein CEP52_007591 [Fusarium oligoseptatum]
MLHIIAECTERIDRLRDWQGRINYPSSVRAWLKRMDDLNKHWMGGQTFRAVFKYEQAASSKSVKDGCEACIMSAIGGRDKDLLDLRASLLSRTGTYGRKSRKEPRLLRLLESWIDHFGGDKAAAIRSQSEMLADTLRVVRVQVRNAKEAENKAKEAKNNAASSTPSRPPVSRAESVTKKVEREVIANNRARQGQGDRGWARNANGQVDYAYFRNRPSSWGSADEESNGGRSESASFQEVPSSDPDELDTHGERAGQEVSNWMNSRMEGQGLSAKERRRLFENDTHPAFSDYCPANSVASVLGIGRRPRFVHSESESGRQPRPRPTLNRPATAAGASASTAGGSVWEGVSVASFSQVGSHVPSHSGSTVARPSTMSTVSSRAPDLSAPRNAPGTRGAPTMVSLPPDDQPYLDFCKSMGMAVNSELLKPTRGQPSDEEGGDSPPPPSSIYSQD